MDKTIQDIKPGEGKVIEINEQEVAVYKNENGQVETLSPVCTHMGCVVEWNFKDRTWDCPCHKSRFAPDGKVLNGPSQKPLEKITIE